jgi:hypothetical protein
MERRYPESTRRLDKQETRLRKSYSKRIDRAKDAMRQKKLRGNRDKRMNSLAVHLLLSGSFILRNDFLHRMTSGLSFRVAPLSNCVTDEA